MNARKLDAPFSAHRLHFFSFFQSRFRFLKGRTFFNVQALSLKHALDLNRKLYGKESCVFLEFGSPLP